MDYKVIKTIFRKNKEIVFFLKEGSSLNSENIVDVDVYSWPERSKREDVDKVIICKKCKKPMKDATFLMMGADKKCFDCHETWNERLGYNLGY